MIPIGDSVRSRSFAYVNVTIIAVNVVVFLYELSLGTYPNMLFRAMPAFGPVSELDLFFFDWGMLPACMSDRFGFAAQAPPREMLALCPDSGQVLLTPLTAMFVHGGWFHLIGNMLFLWVFGDNVEDAMGHIRYAAFYVIVGLAAAAAHVAVNQNDLVPAIGASGAIAGVLGAYLILFPRATITAILPIFFVWLPFYLPAALLIGFWFLLQIFNGVAALGAADVVGTGGGVAWFAHIGGFVAGLLLVRLFVMGRPIPPAARPITRRPPPGW